jgi:hypothetical protein
MSFYFLTEFFRYFFRVSSGGLKVVFCSTLPEFENFDKCHNLSKRNVKLILKILSDLEPLMGLSNKTTLYSTRSCVNWALVDPLMPNKAQFTHKFVK